MAAAATFPTSVADERIRYPYDGTQAADDSVTARHIANSAVDTLQLASNSVTAPRIGFAFVTIEIVSLGAEDGNHDRLATLKTYQLGLEPATSGPYSVEVWATQENGEPMTLTADDPKFGAAGTGTRITATGGRNHAIYETDANGDLTFLWDGEIATAGTYYLYARVVNEGPIGSGSGIAIPGPVVYIAGAFA